MLTRIGLEVSEIVNGHEPHIGENQIDVAMKIRDQGYIPSLPDDCDPVLKELMQMCWKYNPDDRPVSRTIILRLLLITKTSSQTMPEILEFLNAKYAEP